MPSISSPSSWGGLLMVARKATIPGTSTWTSLVSAVKSSPGRTVKTGAAPGCFACTATTVLHAAQTPCVSQPSPSHVFLAIYGVGGGVLLTGPQSRWCRGSGAGSAGAEGSDAGLLGTGAFAMTVDSSGVHGHIGSRA